MGGERGGISAAMCWEGHEGRITGRRPLLVKVNVRIGGFKKRSYR